jgi:Holliday junction resolvasome RuvABC endonuclease subunit
MEYFLGLDISLTSTGYNIVSGGKTVLEGSIKTSKDEPWEDRISRIYETIDRLIDDYNPEVVFIENYSFGSTFGREVLGEIHGVVMLLLLKRNVPFFKVPPTMVKLFGCGKGQTPPVPEGRAKSTWGKTWVVEEVNKNFDKAYRLADNDICDAFVIALLAELFYKAKNQLLDVSAIPAHQKKVLAELVNPKPKTKKKPRRKKENG